MIKLSELLSIEKDINILEKHGYYKSAEVLHDKFIRVAQDYTQMMASYENYLKLIDEFSNIYKNSKKEILENPKIEFRYFCYRYLEYIRLLNLSDIKLNS